MFYNGRVVTYRSRLMKEIGDKIAAREQQGRSLFQQEIALEICADHDGGLSHTDDPDDTLFWLHCGYEETMDTIGQCLKRKADNDDTLDDEPYLANLGFVHLQKRYRIERPTADGKKQLILCLLEDMTDLEVFKKAQEYERQAVAMQEHARELRRYVNIRGMKEA